jgi:hypothetical protein
MATGAICLDETATGVCVFGYIQIVFSLPAGPHPPNG